MDPPSPAPSPIPSPMIPSPLTVPVVPPQQVSTPTQAISPQNGDLPSPHSMPPPITLTPTQNPSKSVCLSLILHASSSIRTSSLGFGSTRRERPQRNCWWSWFVSFFTCKVTELTLMLLLVSWLGLVNHCHYLASRRGRRSFWWIHTLPATLRWQSPSIRRSSLPVHG